MSFFGVDPINKIVDIQMKIELSANWEVGSFLILFFFQAEDGIRDTSVTGVQTCALPIYPGPAERGRRELVEPERVVAEDPAIVVPSDRLRVAVPEDLQHLVRPGIVPDEVPRHPESGRREAVDVAEDRLEGGEVRVHVREDREAHRASRWGTAYICRSQYDARMSRHFAQRAAESHAIFDPSLWPIASPVMPNSRCVAKPLNHWSPAGRLVAPTKPWDIASPHRGHGSIGPAEPVGAYERQRRRIRAPGGYP